MEEFTGDEASQNNQIFPVEPVQPEHVEAAPSYPEASGEVAVSSYEPVSHVPAPEVRNLLCDSQQRPFLQ